MSWLGIFATVLLTLVFLDIYFGDWGGPSDPDGDQPFYEPPPFCRNGKAD